MALAAALLVASAATAADTPWLKITEKSGTEHFLTADGLEMTVSGSNLVCAVSGDNLTLPLSGLSSMEFTTDNSAIAAVAAEEGSAGSVTAYDVRGIKYGEFDSLDAAREALTGNSGVYLLKTKSHTLKITVK